MDNCNSKFIDYYTLFEFTSHYVISIQINNTKRVVELEK